MFSYITISAIGFIMGVYLTELLPMLNIAEITAILVIGSGILFLLAKPIRSRVTVLAAFLVLGAVGCNIAGNYRYNILYPAEGKYVTLTGYVSDIPEQYGDLYSYKLKLSSAEYLGIEYKTNQVVHMSSYEKLDFGDGVEAKGFLKRFSDKKNSTDFNVRRFYQSRGIFYKLYARELMPVEAKTNKLTINYTVTYLRNEFCKIIDAEFSGDDGAILKAVATGNKRLFTPEYKSLLMKTGIIKYFYSAFFHIHFIMLLIGFLFSKYKKSTRDILLAILVIVYATVNSASPVLIKNVLLIIFGLFAMKRFGFSHKPDLIALTTLSVCLTNPLYCFDTGLIMSVSCSLMFYYFYDILLARLSFLPFGRKFAAFYIITTFLMLPVSAYLFNGISLYTNLLGPLFSVTVGLLIIIMPLMTIYIKLFGSALFLKPIVSVLILPFSKLPHILDKLPFSHIYLPEPSMAVIPAVALLFYVIYQLALGEMKERRTICAVAACLGLWGSIAAGSVFNLGVMDVTFINVGQGDGAVINISGGETVLIDGGGKYEFSDYDEGEKTFLPYLIDNGYTKIDKAVISHFHSDHVLGIIAAVRNLDVDEIIMPDIDKDSEYRTEIERLASEKDIPIRLVAAGEYINIGHGAELRVISPEQNGIYNDSNEASLVAELSYNGFCCLFAGDIGTTTEYDIAASLNDCDVVKMPHHGSANSNSPAFTQAIDAEYAIASVGENNIFAFPREEAIYNYQQCGTEILRTDINGDIIVRVEKDGEYRIYKREN